MFASTPGYVPVSILPHLPMFCFFHLRGGISCSLFLPDPSPYILLSYLFSKKIQAVYVYVFPYIPPDTPKTAKDGRRAWACATLMGDETNSWLDL